MRMLRSKPARWSLGLIACLLLALVAVACGGAGQTQQQTAPTTAPAAQAPAAKATTAPAAPAAAATAPAAPAAKAAAATAPAAAGKAAAVQPGKVSIAAVRGSMLDTLRKLADKYQASHPGMTVDVVPEPEGGAFDALIAAGNQPDVIIGSFGSMIGKYAQQNALLALEDMPGAKELYARLDPESVKQVYGHNYYVPLGADVTLMIYNKELFTEAGLDPNKPPQTFDEFLAAAEKIQALPARSSGEKVYGTVFWNDALTWGGWYWNMLQPLYLNGNQSQCQLLNRLGSDIVFDQPDCRLKEFFDFTKKAQAFAPPTMEKNFFSRSIGMWPQYGYSWEPNLKQAAGKPMQVGQDVGVAPVPVAKAGDKTFTTYGGRPLMIMRTTPERHARAWDFIQFLMQDENNLEFIKELGYLPVITKLKSDPYFADPARKPFVDALQTAVFPQLFSNAEDVANTVLGVYQQTVVQQKMTADEAVQQAAQKGREALKK